MGFIKPSVRLDQPSSTTEVAQLEAGAKLPKSSGTSLLQLAGILLAVMSILALAGNPLGLLGAISGAIGGGLIWAAGTITQLVFVLRTIALRAYGRPEETFFESAD